LKKTSYLTSPLGSIELVSFDDAVISLQFCENKPKQLLLDDLHLEVNEQLESYFAGTLQVFSLPFKLSGTHFQEKAWQVLQRIPFGETISYQEQLYLMGYRKGSQAVGQANKRNPIHLIIPCHRVIHQSGEIGGYVGQETSKKRWLLMHEKSIKLKI
jgi:methylated-DNA-[protein]-cysteine S-methyltransferase